MSLETAHRRPAPDGTDRVLMPSSRLRRRHRRKRRGRRHPGPLPDADRSPDPDRRAGGFRAPGTGELGARRRCGRHLRYRATERWVDRTGREFRPYTHYCVGGNTKFWGSVMYRLRREDFDALEHLDGVSPAWPIDYDTLYPYYERAEELYEVHGDAGLDPTEPPRGPYPFPSIPHSEQIAQIVDELREQGLHPSPLPLGLRRPGDPEGCVLCNTCNSFPCQRHAKSEADVCCVRPSRSEPNVTLWTRSYARRVVLTNPRGTRVTAVEIERDGRARRRGDAARDRLVWRGQLGGAAPPLSVRPAHPTGSPTPRVWSGRRYMAHLATMMQGFNPFWKNRTVFQKTVAVNDFYFGGPDADYPLGHIQSQGRVHGVMARTVATWMPLWAYNAWVARGSDWLAMSEDLPRPDNRVVVDGGGRIHLDYQPQQRAGPRRARGAGHPDAEAPGLPSRHAPLASDPEHDASVRHAVSLAPTRRARCSTRTAAPTTSRTSSWSTRRSSRRRPRSTPA